MELESGSRPITYADSKAALSACRDLQSSVWNVRLGLPPVTSANSGERGFEPSAGNSLER